jgi:alpha-D-glucose phosphate-specific phosphoglucomutase
MAISPLAGKPADPSLLINVPRLVTAYYIGRPDPSVPAQRVVFGTSGHRGSALDNAFNEAHILAITQAICLYRKQQSIDGPLYIGMDTHALSEPAFASALEVLAANGAEVMVDADNGYTLLPRSSRTQFSPTIAVARAASRMASSSHHHTIRRASAASNTTRRAADPRTRRSPNG